MIPLNKYHQEKNAGLNKSTQGDQQYLMREMEEELALGEVHVWESNVSQGGKGILCVWSECAVSVHTGRANKSHTHRKCVHTGNEVNMCSQVGEAGDTSGDQTTRDNRGKRNGLRLMHHLGSVLTDPMKCG